jgi:CRISPR-associated protein Csm5
MKLQADQQFTVYITPLTPIHIGCAVDYEPTDTLIHDKNLYHLKDLANWQGAERASLASALARANDFASIQTAFKSKSDGLSPLAPRPVSMPFDGVWTENRGKIKTIERTAFNAVTGNPIIPGSALKGVFRTGYLATLSAANPNVRVDYRDKDGAKKLEILLLEGKFQTDPLRQLKVGDASANAAVHTAITGRASRHRYDMTTTSVPDSGQNFAEAILSAQAHAFSTEISLQHLNNLAVDGKKLPTLPLASLIEAINTHTLATIDDELNPRRHPKGVSADLPLHTWWRQHQSSLARIMQAGAGLLRIGKHGGAEQLTLKEHRTIDQYFQKTKTKAKTSAPFSVNLAKASATQANLLAPFGFALLIPDYARAACDPLLDALLAQMPAEQAALAKAQQAHAAHIEHAAVQRQQWVLNTQAAQQAAADQAQASKEQAAAAQAALDKAAKQSPQQNAIDALIVKAQEKAAVLKGKKLGISDASYAWFTVLVKQAAADSWPENDKQTLAQAVTQHLPTVIKGFMQTEKDGCKALKKLLEPLNLPPAA